MFNTPLETVSDYLTDARILLLDVIAPFRYDDPSLLVALNVSLLETRRLRPDLFVYEYCEKVPDYSANDTEEVHMEPPFRLAVLYGLVGHALSRDQEDVQDARASSFIGMSRNMLVGSAGSPPALRGGTPG